MMTEAECRSIIPLPVLHIDNTLVYHIDDVVEQVLNYPGVKGMATLSLTDALLDVHIASTEAMQQLTVLDVRVIWDPEYLEHMRDAQMESDGLERVRTDLLMVERGGDGGDTQYVELEEVREFRPSRDNPGRLPEAYLSLPEIWDGQSFGFVRLPRPTPGQYAEFLRDFVGKDDLAHEVFPEWYIEQLLPEELSDT